MSHTAIPDDELLVFKSLKYIRTVFDVGARDDIDYVFIKPKIKLHCFEPYPEFYEQLKENAKNYPNITVNNFGLGDVEGSFRYSTQQQAIENNGGSTVDIRRLDDYAKQHRVRRIDFLKIDTEGYEWPVLIGAGEMLTQCRYIQYEQTRDIEKIEELLVKNGFTTHYIGGRNVIAVRKGEAMPWIPKEPQEGGLTGKTEDRYTNWKL